MQEIFTLNVTILALTVNSVFTDFVFLTPIGIRKTATAAFADDFHPFIVGMTNLICHRH